MRLHVNLVIVVHHRLILSISLSLSQSAIFNLLSIIYLLKVLIELCHITLIIRFLFCLYGSLALSLKYLSFKILSNHIFVDRFLRLDTFNLRGRHFVNNDVLVLSCIRSNDRNVEFHFFHSHGSVIVAYNSSRLNDFRFWLSLLFNFFFDFLHILVRIFHFVILSHRTLHHDSRLLKIFFDNDFHESSTLFDSKFIIFLVGHSDEVFVRIFVKYLETSSKLGEFFLNIGIELSK